MAVNIIIVSAVLDTVRVRVSSSGFCGEGGWHEAPSTHACMHGSNIALSEIIIFYYFSSRMYSSECKALQAELEKCMHSTNKVDTKNMTDEVSRELKFSTVYLDKATMTDILSGKFKQRGAHQDNIDATTMTDMTISAYQVKVDAVTMTDPVVELESLPIIKGDTPIMKAAPPVKQFTDIGCQISSDNADKEQQTSLFSLSSDHFISAERSRSYSDSELLDEVSSTSSRRSRFPLSVKANVTPAPLSREVLFCKGPGVARSNTRTIQVHLPTTPGGSVNERTTHLSHEKRSGVARSKTRTIHVHLQTTPGGSVEKKKTRVETPHKCVFQLQVKTLQQRLRSIKKQVQCVIMLCRDIVYAFFHR